MMEYQALLSFQITVVLLAELLILVDLKNGPLKRWNALKRKDIELHKRIKRIQEISKNATKYRWIQSPHRLVSEHDILLDLYLRPTPEEGEALRRARNSSMLRVAALIIAPWLGTTGLVHFAEFLAFI
jgi:hypothetical protein